MQAEPRLPHQRRPGTQAPLLRQGFAPRWSSAVARDAHIFT